MVSKKSIIFVIQKGTTMVETDYTKIHETIRTIIENDNLSVYEKCLNIEGAVIFDLLDEIARLRTYESTVQTLTKILNQDED